MSKSKGRSRTKNPPAAPPADAATSTAVLDPPADDPEHNFEEELEGELPTDQDWDVFAHSDRVGFFELMNLIPNAAWDDKLMIYLYRLSPAVANASGEKKYICRYTHAIDEEMIKSQHGGGRYHAILKRGDDTIKNAKFSIEGEPIYLPGQSLRGPAGTVLPPPGAAAPAAPSDLANIVRQVIDATKGDPTAAQAGIRVMESAMKDGLALNKTILENQISSATGNKVSDKILDLMLPKLLAPPVQDPILGQVLTAVLGMLTKERKAESNPAPAAAAAVDPMQQLSFVKDLLGVDSIKELFEGGRTKSEPFWVTLLSNAFEKLPGLLHEYAVMQQQTFERALYVHQLRGNQPVAGTVLPPGAQIPTAAPATAPVAGTPEQQAQQMVGSMVEAICRAFDEGYPGDVAGAHLKLSYPQMVEQLKPVLTDETQIAAFVASVPALAERSNDQDWPEFQSELIGEIRQVAIPPGEGTSVETNHVTPGAPPVVHVSPRPAQKKKTNGSAA